MPSADQLVNVDQTCPTDRVFGGRVQTRLIGATGGREAAGDPGGCLCVGAPHCVPRNGKARKYQDLAAEI